MDWLDALLLTLINAAACVLFPKLLATVLVAKTKPETARFDITSFPYCTAHTVIGSQSCKFSPNFCANCSPK